MPEMDGISLIKEIRKTPALKFTPILMLTTEASDDKKKAGQAAGATGWIVSRSTRADDGGDQESVTWLSGHHRDKSWH